MLGSRVALRVLWTLSLCCGFALAFGAEPAAAGTCDRADRLLKRTGKGDNDGDGLSNCRERSVTMTLVNDADTDDDALDDGDEIAEGTDPHDADTDDDGLGDGDEVEDGSDPGDADSDDDGVEDSQDATPRLQEVEAYVDALTCPATSATGSLSALGLQITLTETTVFEGLACADLAALASSEGAFVEVGILEDSNGGLSAVEVELENEHEDGDDDSGSDGSSDGEDHG